jgi:signal transduction histidine kinase
MDDTASVSPYASTTDRAAIRGLPVRDFAPPELARPAGDSTFAVDLRLRRKSDRNLGEQRRAAEALRTSILREAAARERAERRRLVGELHTLLCTPLLRGLYAVRRIGDATDNETPEVRQDLRLVEQMILDSEARLREFMAEQHPAPIEDVGLSAAISDLATQFARESGINVRLRFLGDPDRVGPVLSLVLLGAAEEALVNVRKHARATSVRIALLGRGSAAMLRVDDDGRGLQPAGESGRGHGIGLAYLRERVLEVGGSFQIRSGRRNGTSLRIHVDAASS